MNSNFVAFIWKGIGIIYYIIYYLFKGIGIIYKFVSKQYPLYKIFIS